MTYEQELEEKIEKFVKPYTELDLYSTEDINTLVTKVREHFLESRVELLDIRVIGKTQDVLAEFEMAPGYSFTAMKVVEEDGKFTVNVTIDPDDPDPLMTLEFIIHEFNLVHPGIEVKANVIEPV
jgi:hypothetical protein